jgi:uncharacterized protein with ATP-grasp and redox domains
MRVERLTPQCISCLLNKHLNTFLSSFSSVEKSQYMQGVLKILGNADTSMSAPEILELINEHRKTMGISIDFSEIKTHFNKLLMSFEEDIAIKINGSKNPLKAAIKYAMAGNFIDFGSMQAVDEEKLNETLDNVERITIDNGLFEKFQEEISNAHHITYLIDNCGEIVLDKLLIKEISKINKDVKIDAIVRGKPVLNDCTMEDAKQVGLDKLVSVTDNGTAIPGTVLDRISPEAKNLIDGADLIISKGQGNFETLHHCGKNIYYLFLCKCKMFAERFGVDKYTGMFIGEKEIIKF